MWRQDSQLYSNPILNSNHGFRRSSIYGLVESWHSFDSVHAAWNVVGYFNLSIFERIWHKVIVPTTVWTNWFPKQSCRVGSCCESATQKLARHHRGSRPSRSRFSISSLRHPGCVLLCLRLRAIDFAHHHLALPKLHPRSAECLSASPTSWLTSAALQLFAQPYKWVL